MNLHENKDLFEAAISAASKSVEDGGIGIHAIFIEKDYWICRALSQLVDGDTSGRIVFKGGTSLTKAYGIGYRFSEDIDIAVLDVESLSGNQLKALIRKTAHLMTQGLDEVQKPSTSKGSHYYKAYYKYPQVVGGTVGAVSSGELLVEINSFANPYPYQKCRIESFLTAFLRQRNRDDLIEVYNMQPFELNVLDKMRTLTEKLVSLIRCSLANDYLTEMSAKIRHFYDLTHLCNDAECYDYIQSEHFCNDFTALLAHDRQLFDRPAGWRDSPISASPLFVDVHSVWQKLQPVYMRELPQLAYKSVPTPEYVEHTMEKLIARISEIVDRCLF